MATDLEGALALYDHPVCTQGRPGTGHACTVAPESTELPERHPLDVVRFTGLLAVLRARLWYRERSRAITYSGAPWNPEQVFPYVIELDFDAPCRDKVEPGEGDWFRLTLSYPCHVDPRTPAALPVIRALLHRVVTHEADEGLLLADGARPFDPHEGVEAPTQLTNTGVVG